MAPVSGVSPSASAGTLRRTFASEWCVAPRISTRATVNTATRSTTTPSRNDWGGSTTR